MSDSEDSVNSLSVQAAVEAYWEASRCLHGKSDGRISEFIAMSFLHKLSNFKRSKTLSELSVNLANKYAEELKTKFST